MYQDHNATELFKQLTDTIPQRIDNLSTDGGLFLLLDHAAKPRFVGFANHKEGFHGRIYSRHCAGDEGHCYSGYYNSGRMWRKPKVKSENNDAKLAKRLRVSFCREFCRAQVLPTSIDEAELAKICRYLVELYPSVTDWNTRAD